MSDDFYRVFFVRVRLGVVVEKGITDAPGFAAMEQQSNEYRPLSAGEYASARLGESFQGEDQP